MVLTAPTWYGAISRRDLANVESDVDVPDMVGAQCVPSIEVTKSMDGSWVVMEPHGGWKMGLKLDECPRAA